MNEQRILNRWLKSSRNFVIVFFAFSFLMVFYCQNAMALQSNINQNKTANFDGYRLLASNKIELIFDKPPQIPVSSGAQFKLFVGSGTTGQQIAITNAVIGSDNPSQTMTATVSTGFHFPTGGSYVLTTAANLSAATTYTLVMSNTVVGGSGFTFGHTNSNKDISFSFTCPDTLNPGSNSGSVYNSAVTPTVSFKPAQNSTNVSLEGNVCFTVSVPVANYAAVLKGLVLKRNGAVVSYAPYTTTSTVSNSYDCYAPVYNDDHTFFGFLLTQGSSSYYDFNWKPNSTYTLSIPEIDTINGKVIPAQTLAFTTMNGDTPNKMTTNVSAAISGSNVKIGWNAVVAGPVSSENIGWPAASGYNVYVSTNPYWNFVKLNSSLIPQPAGAASTTAVSYTAAISTLAPNTTYYVRVAPVANGFEGGMYCGTANIAFLTPAAAPSKATTVAVSGSTTITKPTYSRTASYTATVKDQYGSTMSGQTVTWSLKTPVTGVSIAPSTGVVTISNTATAGSSFTVVATVGTVTGSKTVTIAVPKVTAVAINGSATITKPTYSRTVSYTATVYDQCWYTISGQTVTWSLKAPVTGVSIAPSTGVVTISNTATAGSSFTVVATVGTVTGSKTVTIAVPKVTAVAINGSATITKPTYSRTASYTATVYDQCWYTMSGQTATWSLKAPVTGVSIAPSTGVVTISNTATAGSSFTVVATVGTVTGSKTVTIAVPKVTAVAIIGSATITKPTYSRTVSYTATVYDQCWYAMSGQTVTWSLKAPVTGVSIASATGVVTIKNTATSGRSFTVVATVGTVTGSKTVTIA